MECPRLSSRRRSRARRPSELRISTGRAAASAGKGVTFAGEGSPFRLLLLLFLIPATVQPLFVYFSYRYQLRADEMVVRQGVLFRNERRIPYSRIQNVDLVQNPLHRIARVAVVRLETASGGKPEAVMRVLSLDAIQELREKVRSDPAVC